MKLGLTIIFIILIQATSFGIDRYAEGDTLYNWATRLNLRESPSLESKIIYQIGIGEKVVTNQNKYYKDADVNIINGAKEWRSLLTGRWVKITYQSKIGYVFDAYLSKYEKIRIINDEFVRKIDTLIRADYSSFYRLEKENGIFKEIGTGMEWGKEIYYIPDFSLEEAIYLIKEEHIDYIFGERKWKVDKSNQKVELSESDGTSWKEIVIQKIENICIIIIEDGV